MRRSTALVLLCLLGLPIIVCRKPAPPPEAHPRVENPELGVAFATVPLGFGVETNEGADLILAQTSGEAPGRMWVDVGPVESYGINLVEVVNSQKALYEELPEGSFSGSRELMSPQGPAYYSRGHFLDGDTSVEETRIFVVHPSENRLVTLSYRYPVGEDSGNRVQELFMLLGELEPLVRENGAGDGP